MCNLIKITFFLSLFAFISCSTDDNISQETKNRGTISFDFEDEKLTFGERSFTGWVINQQKDTVAYFYKSRIRYGENSTEFDDITLFAYLENKKEIKYFEIEFLPRQSKRDGSVYHNELTDEPLKFNNVSFDGTWLHAEFEGKLYYNPHDNTDFVEFKNGKINVPLKGLEIPEKY